MDVSWERTFRRSQWQADAAGAVRRGVPALDAVGGCEQGRLVLVA